MGIFFYESVLDFLPETQGELGVELVLAVIPGPFDNTAGAALKFTPDQQALVALAKEARRNASSESYTYYPLDRWIAHSNRANQPHSGIWMTNSAQSGVLVVQRGTYPIDPADPLLTANLSASLPLSVMEIMAEYKGIEGLLWPEPPSDIPLDRGLSDIADLARVQGYYADFDPRPQVLLCHRLSLDAALPEPPAEAGEFLGCDFGFIESIDNYFSSVLNEVLFGSRWEMRGIAEILNRHLLFPSPDGCRKLAVTRYRALERGADLEEEERAAFACFALWCCRST